MKTIGVDWGSTSFRAYCYDPEGFVTDRIEHRSGILNVENGLFEDTLFSLLGNTVDRGDRILLSGMITSRNGWLETPYAVVSVSVEDYLSLALHREYQGVELTFFPGVCQKHPADVIRGEELQIFGVCEHRDDALVVLPGTHSKWVEVKRGCIERFQTTMTGEVYDVLMKQSLIGLISNGAEYVDSAFKHGLERGADRQPEAGTVLSKIFAARARVLLGQHGPDEVASFLSGVLLGSEIACALQTRRDKDLPMFLIGSRTLCERYAEAFRFLGHSSFRVIEDAAEQGYARISRLLVE